MRLGVISGIGVVIASVAAALLLSPLKSQGSAPRPPYQVHTGAAIPIGMNLSPVTYWSTEEPFIDRFKTSNKWGARVAGKDVDVPVDADGYPTAIPAGAGEIATIFTIDPPGQSPSDTYVLTYRGKGRIVMIGVQSQTGAPGRITFTMSDPSRYNVLVKIFSIDPTDPIRDIHVVRQDQLDLFNRGEIFNPAFLAMASHFSVLRFMDWQHINALAPVDWATRTKPSRASWWLNNDGIPIEVIVRLANEAHTDLWYNVPTLADDAYVRNVMGYIRDNLAPGLRVHVEYSNEVWNGAFPAAGWARQQAERLWGSQDKQRGGMTFYGYRAAQVQAIARQVFGAQAGKRLVGVLGGLLVYPALTTSQTIPGVALANAGTVQQLFGELAITSYFGMPLIGKDDREIILGWAHSGGAGLDAAFHEIEYGGSFKDGDESIAAMGYNAGRHHEIAQKYGLKLVTYEGGLSIVFRPAQPDQEKELTDFFNKLNADPRMGEIYERMVGAFAAGGGTELLHYYDVGKGGRNGFWGVLESIYQKSSPRYDALVRIAGRTRPAHGPLPSAKPR